MQDVSRYHFFPHLGIVYLCSVVAELDSQALEKLRVVGCFLAAVAKPLARPSADFNGQ